MIAAKQGWRWHQQLWRARVAVEMAFIATLDHDQMAGGLLRHLSGTQRSPTLRLDPRFSYNKSIRPSLSGCVSISFHVNKYDSRVFRAIEGKTA
eukprot:scaffold66474_cov36-Cyclotella_meneghiniana.AAC.1